MSAQRLAFLILGLALLGVVAVSVELEQVWQSLARFGVFAVAVVLFIYLLEFVFDCATWQSCLPSLPLRPAWFRRLFLVRLAGEAFNALTPLGGMGGEPVKALLLRKRYGVHYQDSAASLVLAKTMAVTGLIAFLIVGFFILANEQRIPAQYKWIAIIGLCTLAPAIAAFYAVQRYKLTSKLAARIGTYPRLRRLHEVLHHLEAFDDRLAAFYTHAKPRVAAALTLTCLNWVMAALGLYAIVHFLGTPMSFGEAWMLEAGNPSGAGRHFLYSRRHRRPGRRLRVDVSGTHGGRCHGTYRRANSAISRSDLDRCRFAGGLDLRASPLGHRPRRNQLTAT